MKCVYCDAEISLDEEAWALREPQPKCKQCHEDPAWAMEHVRRKGGFGALPARGESADLAEQSSGDIFGSCPECGKSEEFLNIYKTHFFYCEQHGLTWSPGTNMFSGWRGEEASTWRENWEFLRGFRTVDGFGLSMPSETALGEQTSYEDLVPEGWRGP